MAGAKYIEFGSYISDPAYLLLAEGYTLRSVELRKRDDDRQSTHVYYFNETSRIDSISIDTTSNQWTAYILSYHKKSILKTNMTSLQKNDRRKRGVTGTPTVPLPFKQLSTATSTGALQPAQVLVSPEIWKCMWNKGNFKQHQYI